jgi:hypothetical protein
VAKHPLPPSEALSAQSTTAASIPKEIICEATIASVDPTICTDFSYGDSYAYTEASANVLFEEENLETLSTGSNRDKSARNKNNYEKVSSAPLLPPETSPDLVLEPSNLPVHDITTSSPGSVMTDISKHDVEKTQTLVDKTDIEDSAENISHKYGYENSSPDFTISNICKHTDTAQERELSKNYGYEDTASEHDVSKYGYGDVGVEPKISSKYGYGNSLSDPHDAYVSDHGYEDASSEAYLSKYGNGGTARYTDVSMLEYGEAAPDMPHAFEAVPTNNNSNTSIMPRRSSLKGSICHRSRRRASIGACETTDIRLPDEKEPTKRRRSITFKEDVFIQEVTPAVALAERPDDLWMREDELGMISEKIVLLLDSVSTGDATIDQNGDLSVNGRSHCSRGLERHLAPDLAEVKRRQAVECVMNEQFLQRQVGDYDENALANIYKYSTLRSQREAFLRASRDAMEAEDYLNSTRIKCHRRASM